jgi:hypothetical protein
MADFKSLKNKKNLDKLKEMIGKETQSSFTDDPRIWKLEVDKAGNGMAVIRFLPASKDDDKPWVKYYDHAFQGPGGWYIDKCATSIQKECPVCQANTELWNSGVESDKDVARKRKRRVKYVSNIYVIKDPAHPENEGQVKLFRYGKKIFEKIQECLTPKFDDEDPIDPFDLWTGANFKLKQSKYEGYPNYDRSTFDPVSALFDDDDKLEEIWNSEYSLIQTLVDIENEYNYDKQKARMNRVLNEKKGNSNNTSVSSNSAPKSNHVAKLMAAAESDASESDDLDMDYFRKLAED